MHSDQHRRQRESAIPMANLLLKRHCQVNSLSHAHLSSRPFLHSNLPGDTGLQACPLSTSICSDLSSGQHIVVRKKTCRAPFIIVCHWQAWRERLTQAR